MCACFCGACLFRMSRYSDSNTYCLSSIPYNTSIAWKVTLCKSRKNKSWSKFFRLLNCILRDRNRGAVVFKIVYSREWSLISASTTPDENILLVLFVKIKSSKVDDVLPIRVGDLIKFLRPYTSSKSLKWPPSLGRLLLKSPTQITSFEKVVTTSNNLLSSNFHWDVGIDGGL